jgi:hypothetical protein
MRDSALASYESLEKKSSPIWKESEKLGMSIVISAEPRLETVSVTDDLISAQLTDGRIISVPLAWSWRFSEANPSQRQRFEIIGRGTGIRWPEIDEDISVQGMLHGMPARRSH